MPNIGHRAGEQRPGLAPISPVVIHDLADGTRCLFLPDDPLGCGAIPPRRIVTHAVGRVGDHKVRRDATEHARNVGRHCAVAAEQSMAAEHP